MLLAEPFLRLVRAVPTPLKLSTFGGVRDTTSCTRVHAEQESQLNGGSEATFAYSRHFGKISRVFFHTSREISNLPPNSGCEKWCEILRENLERPVRIFQKWLFPTRNALLKLFSRRVPNSHAARLDAFWDPPGQISHQFSHQFSHNFHKFSRTGPGGLLRAFWARPGEAQPSSQATRFARISGPLLRPLGARLAKTREVPRIMRNPAHSHRLHGDLPKNGATDVAAASGASAKMYYYHCPPE